MTPLHNAIKYRHSDVAQVLLEAGAELTNDELHLAILDGSKSKEPFTCDIFSDSLSIFSLPAGQWITFGGSEGEDELW